MINFIQESYMTFQKSRSSNKLYEKEKKKEKENTQSNQIAAE